MGSIMKKTRRRSKIIQESDGHTGAGVSGTWEKLRARLTHEKINPIYE